jgi:hypothetical protein
MELTSHDGAEHRAKRLKRAAILFCEIAGMTEDQARALIITLKDDHGRLDVHWRHGQPTPRQREAFSSAWNLCGEKPQNVQHFG